MQDQLVFVVSIIGYDISTNFGINCYNLYSTRKMLRMLERTEIFWKPAVFRTTIVASRTWRHSPSPWPTTTNDEIPNCVSTKSDVTSTGFSRSVRDYESSFKKPRASLLPSSFCLVGESMPLEAVNQKAQSHATWKGRALLTLLFHPAFLPGVYISLEICFSSAKNNNIIHNGRFT